MEWWQAVVHALVGGIGVGVGVICACWLWDWLVG